MSNQKDIIKKFSKEDFFGILIVVALIGAGVWWFFINPQQQANHEASINNTPIRISVGDIISIEFPCKPVVNSDPVIGATCTFNDDSNSPLYDYTVHVEDNSNDRLADTCAGEASVDTHVHNVHYETINGGKYCLDYYNNNSDIYEMAFIKTGTHAVTIDIFAHPKNLDGDFEVKLTKALRNFIQTASFTR